MFDLVRQSCRVWHDKLHQHALLAGLNEGSVDRATYTLILQAFYQVYAGLERDRTQIAPENVPDAPAFDWLAADLVRSGTSLLSTRLPGPLPAVDNLSRLFGYLYVKQGSTLGGQVIARHLGDNLKRDPGIGTSFFQGYGSATGPNWKKFCNAFEQYAPQLDGDQVTETAVAVFAAIHHACDAMLATEAA